MRILLVEDDELLLDLLQECLRSQHYIVDAVADGKTAWEYAETGNHDLILMDVGLPGIDGITLCKKLRDHGCKKPILLITAKNATSDRIRGLDAGADDYLIKPLDLAELQARVRALLRRKEVAHTNILQLGNLQINPVTCQAKYGEKILKLTPKEYSLLEILLKNPGRVFSRGQIIEHLWTFDDPPMEDSVKAHVKGLRQKLKAAGAVDWIENIYGLGYRLQPPVNCENDKKPENDVTKTLEAEFNEAREGLWLQYQGLMQERLELLQAASQAAQTQVLSEQLRQQAGQAAHKLAGVLGMFERDAGTEVARELEEILLRKQELVPGEIQILGSLVQQLTQVLNLGTSPTTAQIPPVPATVRKQKGDSVNSLGVKVLIVDDDPLFLATLPEMLEPWGIDLTCLDDSSRFWDVLPQTQPDLLILDVEMPQYNGIQLCQQVRANQHWQSLPILFLTGHSDRQTIQDIFKAGADDYITKPIVGTELLTRINQRLERIRLLQNLATKDSLTAIANQFQSSQHLTKLIDNYQPFCLILLSLPTLRNINLEYGHSVGNQILQRWGQLLRSTFPDSPGLGYWGHGEFVWELMGSQKAAEDILAQLMTTLRQQVFTALDGTRFQAPFNLTVAEYPRDGLTLQSLYQAANAMTPKGVGNG
jgi:diguanylate cyclase (GGDEF)-like protein